jgi:DNA-binding MarR family transcriptional regulator
VIVPLLLPYTEEPAKPLALPAPPPRLQRSDDASPDTKLLDAKLLRAMIADPSGTQEQWAAATGVVKSNVNRRLMRLKREGLVTRVIQNGDRAS